MHNAVLQLRKPTKYSPRFSSFLRGSQSVQSFIIVTVQFYYSYMYSFIIVTVQFYYSYMYSFIIVTVQFYYSYMYSFIIVTFTVLL